MVNDFWEKRYDVLVCTTIVESGLDISNANTLIVERADVMGLSNLHQLRGRVGRSRERAYAYFLYPPEKPLTETAHDRLATIAAHSDLGAGMYVAMKDLEIRGAGNLLGGEQSGHIAAVGFDLYVRLVGEAVADFKGEAPQQLGEVKVELPVDAHLPHDYIPGERLRLEAYRKLASVATEEELAGGRRRARRPLRRAARAGHQPRRGRPVPAACPRGRTLRRGAGRSQRAVRPRRPAGEPADAAAAALPGLAGQVGRPYDPGADTVERTGRRQPAARRRAAPLVPRRDRQGAGRRQRPPAGPRRTELQRRDHRKDKDRDGATRAARVGLRRSLATVVAAALATVSLAACSPDQLGAAAVVDGTTISADTLQTVRSRVPRDRAQRRPRARCSSTSSRR